MSESDCSRRSIYCILLIVASLLYRCIVNIAPLFERRKNLVCDGKQTLGFEFRSMVLGPRIKPGNDVKSGAEKLKGK